MLWERENALVSSALPEFLDDDAAALVSLAHPEFLDDDAAALDPTTEVTPPMLLGSDDAEPLQQLSMAPLFDSEVLVRPWAYWIFHSNRLFGWAPLVPLGLALRPQETILALLSYIAIHRQRWWQLTVHRFLGYGASRRHTIVNDYKHMYPKGKRCLLSLHPHSLLVDGWHSIIARNHMSFDDDGDGPPELGRKVALCFAPVISHVPVHQEMYRNLCCGSDRNSIVSWWRKTTDTDPAVVPGGFSESIFTNAAETKYEYSYIKDRKGFVKICLEERKPIMPVYTFGSTRMYYNPSVLRGLRARLSQKIYVGLVLFLGKWGTAMPLTELLRWRTNISETTTNWSAPALKTTLTGYRFRAAPAR